MGAKFKVNSTTFTKFDKVNGRSYKTVRAKPSIGPTPTTPLYAGNPQKAEELALAEQSFVPAQEFKDLEFYNEVVLEDNLESDSLQGWEAGLMRGYLSQ